MPGGLRPLRPIAAVGLLPERRPATSLKQTLTAACFLRPLAALLLRFRRFGWT